MEKWSILEIYRNRKKVKYNECYDNSSGSKNDKKNGTIERKWKKRINRM